MPDELSSVVIPTYNEAENIRTLVGLLLDLPCDLRVIVVDDNSPDGTGRIVDELAASDSRVVPVHRPGKMGLGTAHIAGFHKALDMGSTLVLSMDADLSHPPSAVPALIAKMAEVDLCIGSRYVRGGGAVGCTGIRRALSYGANGFARVLLGLHAHDCTAGYRCYRRVVLETVGLDSVFSNGYSFLIELLYRAQRQGYRIGETPIIFENRRLGASKISRGEILKAMYTVLRLRWPGLPWDRWLARRSRTETAAEKSR
jgi:dolichol-phosphate mannosyltransferase